MGPSLIEIAGLYQKDPEGFVKWTMEPGKKRAEAIQMPSMAHVGKEPLMAIHAYILDATKDKVAQPRRKKKSNTDPYPREVVRPDVQRIFMEGASPAAIAVALPDSDLNYCFDAGECRLRYVWKGADFLSGWPYWRSNGVSFADRKGDIVYTANASPISSLEKEKQAGKPKFLGYTLDKSGLPTFRYRIGGVTYTETIKALSSGNGITREITSESTEEIPLQLDPSVKTTASEQTATSNGQQSVTVTQTWK